MLVIIAKGFLTLQNLYILIKQKRLSLPINLALRSFSELPIVFATKVNLLYLLNSTVQSFFSPASGKSKPLKTFLKIAILMTLVSLYLIFLGEII